MTEEKRGPGRPKGSKNRADAVHDADAMTARERYEMFYAASADYRENSVYGTETPDAGSLMDALTVALQPCMNSDIDMDVRSSLAFEVKRALQRKTDAAARMFAEETIGKEKRDG